MEILVLLLVVSLIISGGFLFAFILQMKNGQFDDTTSPAEKILFDNN